MTRRESRISAFELLFEAGFHKGTDPEKIYGNALEIRGAGTSEFTFELYDVCMKHLDEIDMLIGSASEKWKVSRMNRVTRTILRLAVGEFMYTDTPPKAAINEAVEIAKIYGDDKAPAFVNGVLNRLARSQGKLADNAEAQP